MSILQGLFPDQGDPRDMLAASNEMTAEVLANADLDERTRSIVEHMSQGLPLADVLGLKPEHIEALLTQALQYIQADRFQMARDVLLRVIQLSPLESRSYYLLGTSFQIEGDLRRAAHFYMQFLALDATNPDGYLRLGECLMAAGERDNARDALSAARAFARDGKGRPEAQAQAERLLASLDPAAAN